MNKLKKKTQKAKEIQTQTAEINDDYMGTLKIAESIDPADSLILVQTDGTGKVTFQDIAMQ